MTTTHTPTSPLPWFVGHHYRQDVMASDGQVGTTRCTPRGFADAAYIVECVNAHASLTQRVAELEQQVQDLHLEVMESMGREIDRFLDRVFKVDTHPDVQEVDVDLPESAFEKNICNITWSRDPGDPSVGIPSREGFVLAKDQSGTWLAEAAERIATLERALEGCYLSVNSLLTDAYTHDPEADGFVCKRCGELSPTNPDRSSFRTTHGGECRNGKAIASMREAEAALRKEPSKEWRDYSPEVQALTKEMAANSTQLENYDAHCRVAEIIDRHFAAAHASLTQRVAEQREELSAIVSAIGAKYYDEGDGEATLLLPTDQEEVECDSVADAVRLYVKCVENDSERDAQRVAELERALFAIRELTSGEFRYAPTKIYELADSALAEKNAPARGETATKDSSGGAGVGVPTTKPCTRCGLTVGVQADGLCDACQGELRGYGFEGG